MKEKGETRILFLTDIHAPYHDQKALDTAVKFGLEKGSDEVIISELPDLYKVSSWLTDPNAEPFYKELEQDRAMVRELAKIFKKQKVTYLCGNHEERIDRYLKKRAEHLYGIPEFSIPSMLGINDVGWEFVDNKILMGDGKEPLKRGHLTFLHGHEIPLGWGAVNVAKVLYEKSHGNIIAGHFHRCQEWVIRKIDNNHEGVWTVGCLGDLHPEYSRHNNWVHGFAVVHLYKDGNFSVENRKIIKGRVL